ncbi:hypothetical protein CKQ54_15125 [Rahnella variigena]|uniref:Secreted protein n=1 Tax=Rahnella variigena TaxID=574964 RepID=A0ABX9PYC3_9GAMM|nr:hypothetical protein D6D38_12300 [Rahnella variigena]RKF69617.1 hypothetical protein CKQ54_15125 [Rahnella variigena]
MPPRCTLLLMLSRLTFSITLPPSNNRSSKTPPHRSARFLNRPHYLKFIIELLLIEKLRQLKHSQRTLARS